MSRPIQVAVEVCPVCGNTRRLFTCFTCINTGNFNSSDKRSPYGNARYSERKKRLRLLNNLKDLRSNEFLAYHNKQQTISEKRKHLNELQLRINLLNCSLALAENQLSREKENLEMVKLKVDGKEISISVAKKRLSEAQSILNQPQLKVDKNALLEKRNRYKDITKELQLRRCHFIRHLVTDIFPISVHTIFPEFGTPPRHTIATQISNVDVVLETSITAESDLEEATRTAYIGGKWISEIESPESEHCILDVGLPSSGDYYKYYEWLKSQRNLTRSEDSTALNHTHPALAIPAALGYTAQLVEQIASCLDIHLTIKAHHSEFCVHVGARKKFFDSVNRLNNSIAYICFAQGSGDLSLDPCETLRNLKVCLSPDNPMLGRSGSFEPIAYEIPDCPFDSDSSVEELNFDVNDNESEGEPGDWDSLMDLPEVPDSAKGHKQSIEDEQQSMSASDLTAASSRLVSSAAASVAALWPWNKQ